MVDGADKAIAAMDRVSLLAQLKDKVIAAQAACQPRCGNCFHWMKRTCPHEMSNMTGYKNGPSSDASPCSKHQWATCDISIVKEKIETAVAFAQNHNLPIPSHLAVQAHRRTKQ